MINEGLDFAAIEQELIKIGFEASLVTNFMKELFGFQGND
jgi:hypothetical protein